ncbi:DUF7093 family protein [Halomarina ordinaria]|uniref:Rubrerythrin-like domain-containing protein n=1 Tax=Halomarina ordinaria TaxID=3033939 RepID=A0ABD5U7Z3_9EURY|nr:hypothetical protein [Halomarina sp. PSRA2]
MALKCSLLGHEFGDAELDREREERGSEVVTSVREVVVCEHCGAERVISENTEVTAVVDEDVLDAGDEPGEGETDTDTDTDIDTGTDAPSDPEAPDEADGPDGPDDGSEDPPDPAEEDAVILTDAPEEREYGEWPAEEGHGYRPWNPDELLSEARRDDDGPTVAEAAGLDPEAVDADAGADAASDALADDADDPDGTTDANAGTVEDTGAASPTGDTGVEVLTGGPDEADDPGSDPDVDADLAPGVEPAAGPASDPDVTYVCGSCGYAVEAFATSLRAGDACPECRVGYLGTAERNP